MRNYLRWSTPAVCCTYLLSLRKQHIPQLWCWSPRPLPNPPRLPIYHHLHASSAWPTPHQWSRRQRPRQLHAALQVWSREDSHRTPAESAFQTEVCEGSSHPSTVHTAVGSFPTSLLPSRCSQQGSCKFPAGSRQLQGWRVLQISTAQCTR